ALLPPFPDAVRPVRTPAAPFTSLQGFRMLTVWMALPPSLPVRTPAAPLTSFPTQCERTCILVFGTIEWQAAPIPATPLLLFPGWGPAQDDGDNSILRRIDTLNQLLHG